MRNFFCAVAGYVRKVLGVSRLRWATALATIVLLPGVAGAATYTSASVPFAWVDSATHTKIGHLTTPYKFNGAGSTGCGTTPPTLDDTISDVIPIGFTFVFGTTGYTSLRVQTNGRLQFGNTTCGAGTNAIGPPQTYPYLYPNAAMNATMKVFGVDLDPTSLANVANYPTASNRTTCTSISVCYISVATLGTAPTRQFVVTWKNVPEWVSASNTSGSFDLQMVLNEDGTFVYQYGTIIHGGTGTAQIGWQLTTGDFAVATFGASAEPPPSTAILFYIPSTAPLADYQFEQGAWSPGAAGQVADSSGNGRAGTAAGSVQATAGGKVCRGAEIPANTSAAAVDAILSGLRFSDSGVNMLGQGTVMFWYRANAAWSGAGALAAQLLDATRTSGQWFALTKTSSGTLVFEVTDSTGTVRAVETAAQNFAAGTWVHIAVAWNFNALAAANSDSIRIFVNGGAPSVSSFTTTGSLSNTLGYLAAGDNPSGFSGSRGSVNSANGTLDELRIYNIELNQGQVSGASALTRGCSTLVIDHLELRHASWSGIACAPGLLTVAACADAACTVPYTSGVVVSLSAGGAATVWDPAAGGATLVIGAGQSSVTRSFYSAVGTATMNVTGTGVPVLPANPKKCNGVGNSCNWTSANGGLLMTLPSVPVAGVLTGGKPVALTLQAVQSSGPTPGAACVPVQNLAGAGIKAWSVPANPVAFMPGSISAGVTVGGPPQVANAQAGPYAATPSTLPGSNNLTGLVFDSTATSTVWLKHMDTGQFNLNATLDTVASASTPALSLAGSTLLTSLPVGYGVAAATVRAGASTQTACAAGASAACDAAAAANTRVASAGDAFSTTVTAALWTVDADADLADNPVAPGYAGAVVLSPLLAAPGGGNVGSLVLVSGTLAGGSNLLTGQRWTQSGALRIGASGTYLSNNVTGQSDVLGRFSPKNFTTTLVSHGCGAFTYSGQPVALLTVKAMDASAVPAVASNYRGAFARAVTVSDGAALASGSFSANVIAAAGFAAGSANISPVFTFTSPKTAPLTLQLRAVDADAVSSSGFAEGAAPVRSGRLSLLNAYGSELLALPLPLTAQYWDGGSYVTNNADSCTVLPASSISLGAYVAPLSACATQLSPTGNLVFAAGRLSGAGLTLTRPGPGRAGSVELNINAGTGALGSTCLSATPSPATAANLPWFGPNLKARASFGVFKSPIIYGRENY